MGFPRFKAAKAEVIICVLGVVVNVAIACNLFLPHAWQGRNDFLGMYAGAKLAGTQNLYDRNSVRAEQLSAIGETGEILFVRLPIYALALRPLGWLSYRTAYVAWEMILAAALLGFLVLWPSPVPFTKWFMGCWLLPVFIGIFNGQDDLLLLVWVALAARLLRKGKPFAAGMILALFLASKFHLFALVPLVLVAQRRWQMLAGVTVTACSLLAASFLVAGRSWPLALYRLLADSGISQGLDRMPNLHSLLAGARFSSPLLIGASVVIATGVYAAARHTRSFELALGLALGAGVSVAYHSYAHDGTLYLPALIAFSSGSPAYLRVPAVLLPTPVPWLILHLTRPFSIAAQLILLAWVLGQMAWLASPSRCHTAKSIDAS